MAEKGNKCPPILSKARSYNDWLKLVNIWTKITCIPKASQGGAILMTLEGEAQDAVLELSEDIITSEDSVKHITEKLNSLYKKNETLEKYECLDQFETYHRPEDVSMNDFIIEFDSRLNKTKKLGTVMSDDLLAYRLIKSANLSEQDEKVVKATTTLEYEKVKSQLKSIFSDTKTGTSSSFKTEDVNESCEETYFYQRGRNSRQRYPPRRYPQYSGTNRSFGNSRFR